jgi:flagellar hook-length control protein FliK
MPRYEVSVPLQHTTWPQAMGERVTWMVNQQVQQAELRLNPPDLGMLEVRVAMQDDKATLNFHSPLPHVREALEAALPRLREALAEQGIALGDAQVSHQSLAQHQPAHDGRGGTGHGRSGDAQPTLNGEDSGITTPVRVGEGMLDLYA